MERFCCSHPPPSPLSRPAQLPATVPEVNPPPRHKFPPLHERATPAEKARLLAYLETGRCDKAAKRCGCCRRTISRTWDRYRRDIAEALGL
jgi:predicted DNA-binding protein (UPF0251 family)